MLEQNKQRLLALVIIIIIVVGALAYSLWAFVFNKGTLVFNGEPPYSITLHDKEYTCENTVCEFTLGKGVFGYVLAKEGHATKRGTVSLARGDIKQIDATLRFIPEFKASYDYSIYNLPVGYSKFAETLLEVSLFNSFDSNWNLKRLPKKLQNLVFAPSGEMAVVFEDDVASLYRLAEADLFEVEGLGGARHADFNADESVFYSLAFDEDVKKYALKKVAVGDLSTENLIFFIRDVDDYLLKVSSDESMAILIDKTNSPEILYKIDLIEKSRKNIYEGDDITLGDFSFDNSMLVFKEGLDLKYLNIETEDVHEFDFKGQLTNFSFAPEGKAYFVSDSGFMVGNFGIEFLEKKGELTVEDLFDEVGLEKTNMLFEWDYTYNEFNKVLELDFEEELRKIEASSDGKVVRFLVGDQVYDLVVGE